MDGESTAVPYGKNMYIRTLSTFCLQYILCSIYTSSIHERGIP